MALSSSSSYLLKYQGRFFHSGGCRKDAKLKPSLNLNNTISLEQLTDKVLEATEGGKKRKEHFVGLGF